MQFSLREKSSFLSGKDLIFLYPSFIIIDILYSFFINNFQYVVASLQC